MARIRPPFSSVNRPPRLCSHEVRQVKTENRNEGVYYPSQASLSIRDISGVITADGRCIRRGRVFRSEVPASKSEQDLQSLDSLRVTAVFDLRNPSERSSVPASWPRATAPVVIEVMPHELQFEGADMRKYLQRLREGALDAGGVREAMHAAYRAMPSHFGSMLSRFFGSLANRESGATLIHCTAGKDRTGFACAMLLYALGVSPSLVMDDYLESAKYCSSQSLQRQLDIQVGSAMDSRLGDTLLELTKVRSEYLDVALFEITTRWGSIDQYLRDEAGVDKSRGMRLRSNLLV